MKTNFKPRFKETGPLYTENLKIWALPLLFQLLIFHLSKVCLLLSPRCLETCEKQVSEQDLKMLLFKTILWIWKLLFFRGFSMQVWTEKK